MILDVSDMGDIKPVNVEALGTRPLESCTGYVVACTSQDVFSLGAMLAQVMVHRSLFRDNLFAHEVPAVSSPHVLR